MRTLLLIALVACGSAKTDDSTTPTPVAGAATGTGTTTGTGTGTGAATGTGTGTGAATGTGTGTGAATGTGTGSTTPVEACDDGVDNDLDGLLDCEDSDCTTDAACFESACGDGIDNDADGLQDCEDTDCWGNGCEVRIANFTGADRFTVNRADYYLYARASGTGTASCSTSTWHFAGQAQLVQPRGTLRILPASGTAWTTCNWSAGTSSVGFSSSSVLSTQANPVTRRGFAIDAGCPVQTSGFLPGYWRVSDSFNQLEIRPGSTGQGDPWFRVAARSSYTFTWPRTSTITPGPPCTTWRTTAFSTVNYFGVTSGDDQVTTIP